MERFFGEFASKDDTIEAFRLAPSDFDGIDVLVASYDTDGWEGSARVVFRCGDELFEVYASHCSCHGLEDQWNPERVVPAELHERMVRDGSPFAWAVLELLGPVA